jgi:hypothetical protein
MIKDIIIGRLVGRGKSAGSRRIFLPPFDGKFSVLMSMRSQESYLKRMKACPLRALIGVHRHGKNSFRDCYSIHTTDFAGTTHSL